MSPNAMEPHTLAQMFDALEAAFSHIPYAICGRAAMHAWGFDGTPPKRVSVICPAHCKDSLRGWAAANGAYLDPSCPELIGIPTVDGEVRKVRVKYLDTADFEALRIVQPRLPFVQSGIVGRPGNYDHFYEDCIAAAKIEHKRFVEPRVLSLASMLDQAALAYKSDRRAQTGPCVRSSIGQDALWMVGRIAELLSVPTMQAAGGGPLAVDKLSAATIPQVLDPLFWDVFSLEYPEAPSLFARAGLLLPRPNPYGTAADGRSSGWPGADAGYGRVDAAKRGSWTPDGRSLTSVWTIPEETAAGVPRTAGLSGTEKPALWPRADGPTPRRSLTSRPTPSPRADRATKPSSSRKTERSSMSTRSDRTHKRPRPGTKSSGSRSGKRPAVSESTAAGPLANMNREF